MIERATGPLTNRGSLAQEDEKLLERDKLRQNFCPGCGSSNISIFYELRSVPVQSVRVVPTRETALDYARGNILLGFCQECGFIYNTTFDPVLLEYSSTYESTQAFSPTFNDFACRLADRLIGRYDLHNKVVLEIGCGNGEFLTLLCRLGGNRGVGFDPAYVSERSDSEAKERITFIKDYYSEKYAHYQADFVCCKMTLEHIQVTADFVGTVRRSIGDRTDTVVFFQVPNAERIFRDCSFEDIYYEHCSYFSVGSLSRLFRNCGFDVIQVETDYQGQYLMIEAKPANSRLFPPMSQEDDLEKLKGYVSSFRKRCRDKLSDWQARLQNIPTNGRRAVLWGSGSKGVAFLTSLEASDAIKYVVDINPYRQGTFMPGTGQEIVAPDFLLRYRPDIVVVMNAVYCQEIKGTLNRLGLAPELIAV